jgi:Transposase protein
VTYLLHDQAVRFLKGKLRLRQVTRLTPETGHQTPIVTSRWDLSDIVIAYRMFERWRQENFFKYLRQEFLIDALTDYAVEPEDLERSVPNPARKAVNKELREARAQLALLRQSYGTATLDYLDGRTPTMRAFTEAEQRLQSELDTVQTRIARLRERQKTVPVRVALRETTHGAEAVKLSTERKHLTNVLKMVAYQIESTLVEQLRPYYARTDDEGRTLIQTALRSGAAIDPTGDELRITLVPLSSPHRSAALRQLCEDLNKTRTRFPGSDLRLCLAVAQSAPS